MNFFQRFKDFLHWQKASKPQISLSSDLYEQLKPFRTPLILIQMTMLIGSLGYVIIEDYDLTNAIFQTGYTFTTVGFGSLDEATFSPWGKMFTIFLILIGFTILTFSLGLIVETINRGHLVRIMKERRMLYRIARLKNHYVVCYHNEYSIQLSHQFRENHIPFVVIDPMKDFAEIAHEHRYPYYINEEPHTETALLKSHLSSAKGVITFSKNIADNIAQIASTRLFEKELGRTPYYIIASAETHSDQEKLKKLGADSVVSPTKLMAQRVSAMATRPDMENLLEQFVYKKDTPLDIEEILVPKHSWMVLKKLKEAHFRDITNVSVVGITQKDGKFIPMPTGDTLITSECKLLVIGASKGMRNTRKVVNRMDKPQELKYV